MMRRRFVAQSILEENLSQWEFESIHEKCIETFRWGDLSHTWMSLVSIFAISTLGLSSKRFDVYFINSEDSKVLRIFIKPYSLDKAA